MEIITILASNISLFLYKNNIVDRHDLEIYQYGFEMIISTILGFIITLIIGIILNMSLLSIAYYIIFVFLRQLTGGYHANTYLKCNTLFAIITFTTLGTTKLLCKVGKYNMILLLIIVLFSLFVVLRYAPVENPNKSLGQKQIKQNRKVSLFSFAFFNLLSFILYFSMIKASLLISLTLLNITLLIVISKLKEGDVCDEKEHS